jgi:Fe2+ transport system protein B
MFRSLLAILAGLVALTIASFAIEAAVDPLLMHLFPRSFPDAAALSRSLAANLVMFTYTFGSIVLGGYVTAWVATRAKVRHAVIMGVIEALLTVWLLSTRFHQALVLSLIKGVIVCIPSAWLGGVLRAGRRVHPQQSV